MPKIQCECKRVLAYRDDQAGKRVKCPACSAKILLPAAALSAALSAAERAKAEPPGAAAAAALLNRRLAAQVAALTPTAPRKGPSLAAPPGRTTPAYVMPSDTINVAPADADIPLAGDVPTWGSGPQPDAPAQSAPRATP